MRNEVLVERLRYFGEAYPVDLWPPMTEDERRKVGSGLVSRISADMGRHCAKIMDEAADALAEAASDIEEQQRILEIQAKLLSHTVNILRGPPPELKVWSYHDIPELVSLLSKHEAQLGTFVKLVQHTLGTLADSARILFENMEYEERKHERSEAAETRAAEGDVPVAEVQSGPRPSSAGDVPVDLLFQGRPRAVDPEDAG